MILDDLVDALQEHDPVPAPAMQAALEQWDEVVPRFRTMLRCYADGSDVSERTERALFPIIHLLGEKEDTACFPDLCRLAESQDRLDSVFGPDGIVMSYPAILVSTFDRDPAPLFRIAELETADSFTRSEALLAVTFLVGMNRIPERTAYDFLAGLPARLNPRDGHDVWWAYATSIATLGFAGLSAAVDAAFDRNQIPAQDYTRAEFWRDLRDAKANGRDFSDQDWERFQPFESAVEQLSWLMEDAEQGGADAPAEFAAQEPLRNAMRGIGRNDPCPCGSGKKFKKCCLQAAAAEASRDEVP